MFEIWVDFFFIPSRYLSFWDVTDRLRIQTGLSILNGLNFLHTNLAQIRLPIYAEHGDDDGVTTHLGNLHH